MTPVVPLTRPIMQLGDASAAAGAIVAIGFAVASAHGPVLARADLRTLGAPSGMVSRAAFCRHWKIAEQAGAARLHSPAAAHSSNAACVRAADAHNDRCQRGRK